MKKSQVATEYLVIVAVGILILIPITVYLNDIYVSYKDESKTSHAKTALYKLTNLANWVYSQGEPARITTNIYIPESVESINFSGKNINFRIKTKNGFIDISENSIAELDGYLPIKSGYYNVLIMVENNKVNITVIK